MSKVLTELIRDANRNITPADRHAILDLIEQQAARIAELDARYAEASAQVIYHATQSNAIHDELVDANARIAALESQIAALTGKVDGWKLVPIEPTSEMILHNSDCSHHAWDDKECPMRAVRFKVWRNMIAAAPDPAPVAPAVGAQPVAEVVGTEAISWVRVIKNGLRPGDKLYASAQSEGFRKDADLSLRALYEDACIQANKNAQDAARWRYAVKHWLDEHIATKQADEAIVALSKQDPQ